MKSPEFWRGFGNGFSASLRTRSTRTRVRIGLFSGLIGSIVLPVLVERRQVLTFQEHMGFALAGGVGLYVLVSSVIWLAKNRGNG